MIGAACAYYLANRGVAVLLLEARHLAAGASGATAGMVGASGGSPAPLRPLALQSVGLLLAAVEDFEPEPEIKHGGSIFVALDAEQAEALETQVQGDEALGIASRMLDAQAAREVEPLLSEHVVAAVHRPADYHLNPFLLCRGYLGAAVRKGAVARFGVKVLDVVAEGDRVVRVVTDEGDIACGWIVNAAGAHAPQIMGSSRWRVPVEPGRGQVIVTEATAPLTPHMINSPGHLYTRQTKRGNFLIGSETERVGFDSRITLDNVSRYARGVAAVVPLLTRLAVIRFHTGWRPLTPDDLPVIGPLPDCPRLLMATGHGRSGVILSAITGSLIADLVVEGAPRMPIDLFSIERFGRLEQYTRADVHA